jgi:RimJ/RimL family protein N-acetyltransferase
MNELYRLRPATLDDARRLLDWRNDPATRDASRNGDEIAWETHKAWLGKTLADPARRLYVAERDGVPIGAVRADFSNGAWELSWTIAPEWRGQGLGSVIVKLAAEAIAEPICAYVKAGNAASARVAERAGMRLEVENGGLLRFARGAVDPTGDADD